MSKLSGEAVKKGLGICAGALFILFLLAEWLLPHSLAGQISMALFCLSALALAAARQKLTVSIYFLFALLAMLWCAVGLIWSVDGALTLAKLKTLGVNWIFLFCFSQYCGTAGSNRLLKEILAAVGLFILIVCAGTGPTVILKLDKDLIGDRFGQALGVNANDAAFVTGLGFSAALWLGTGEDRRSRWWLLALLPLGLVIALTSSLKGFLMIAIVTIVYLMLRYPRGWGWKLICLAAAGGAALYLFTAENIMARFPSVYYRVTVRLQELWNAVRTGSVSIGTSLGERSGYLALGLEKIGQRAFTGWGLDCFRSFAGSNGTYSHNNYIELMVSGGIPLLGLYLAPFVRGLAGGIRKRGQDDAVKLLVAIAAAVLVLDFAMVSYFDRTTQMVPVMLLCFAGTEANLWGAAGKYLKNPFRVFSTLGSHGKLRFLGDKTYLKLVYRGRMGKRLRLCPPVGFTEKLQWMKLYDRNPLYPVLADKAAVRRFVSSRAGEEALIPLLGIWEKGEDIDFSLLPECFVLKCTHDSGGVRVCADRERFDSGEAVRFLNGRLKKNYYWTAREWAYRSIVPRLMGEAFIGGEDGSLPDDYKFFCFNGEVKALCVCRNRVRAHADYYFLTPEYELFPVNQVTRDALQRGVKLEKPGCYQRMLTLARTLSQGIAQVRVDLYDGGGKVYFGEMTLYDQGGFDDEYIDHGDERMGAYYQLPGQEA